MRVGLSESGCRAGLQTASSPGSDALRLGFTTEERRTQRRSDGTISLLGRRFEIPATYRALTRPVRRYATWDLT